MFIQRHKTAYSLRVGLAFLFLLAIAPAAFSFGFVADTPAQSGASTPPAQAKLSKLAPEPVIILLREGKGSVSIAFARPPNTELPGAYRFMEAVGGSASIPGSAFSFAWDNNPPQKSTAREILIGTVNVHTSGYIEPKTEYKGKLILTWPDSESAIDITIISREEIDFEISRDKVEATLGPWEPKSATLLIKNKGNVRIGTITISSDLRDDSTGHRAAIASTENVNIEPAQEKRINIPLPSPTLAGTYTGTLDIIAEGKPRKTIPLTLRTRGPVWFDWYGWPFLLLALTLALGFYLSSKLDDWFNRGLHHAQATLSLQGSEKELFGMLERIKKWESEHAGITLPNAKARLELSLSEIRRVISSASEKSKEQLEEDVKRFASVADLNNYLWDAVVFATNQWGSDPAKLKAKIGNLDLVAPSDPKTYREALLNALQGEGGQSESGAFAETANQAITDKVTGDDLRAKIRRMARLNQWVLWLVIFIVAYIFFYYKDQEFGELLDYMNVFLWALGLTQAGANLLARVPAPTPR